VLASAGKLTAAALRSLSHHVTPVLQAHPHLLCVSLVGCEVNAHAMQGELLLPLPLLLLLLPLPPPAAAISTSATIAAAAFQLISIFRTCQHILSKSKAAHLGHVTHAIALLQLHLLMTRMFASSNSAALGVTWSKKADSKPVINSRELRVI
jgi:hypothetical protein